MIHRAMAKPRTVVALFLMAAVISAHLGCGESGPPMVKVSGVVRFADGTPLDHGIIQLQQIGSPLMAKGEVDRQGRFSLSTRQAGDGVEPGKYRAAIVQLILTDLLPLDQHQHVKRLDPKFASFETSELEFEFTLDGPTEIVIPVTEAPGGG
ncbi:MAG TPA: hypothetical protein PLI18_14040 [Pirellulaceae bacterium]|nr:hypothetical protein [Pirellulaceae bacterium]